MPSIISGLYHAAAGALLGASANLGLDRPSVKAALSLMRIGLISPVEISVSTVDAQQAIDSDPVGDRGENRRMIQIIGPTSNTAYSASTIQPITEIEPMNIRYVIFLTAAAACIQCAAAPAHAQTPYAGEQTREIKVLSAGEIENYRNGEGMGFAKAAELNSYPGPKHVLQLSNELHLKPAQLARIEQLYADMKENAVELGEQIIERERALDAIFAHRKADARAVRDVVRAIGALQADLRFVHLNAHVETRDVLTREQVAHYDELRGYGEGPDSGGHDHSKMNH